jgi:hypothetical protein
MAVMSAGVVEDLEIAMIVEETVMAVEVLVALIAILAVVEIVEDVLKEEMIVIVHQRREALAWIVKENLIVQMKIWSACSLTLDLTKKYHLLIS